MKKATPFEFPEAKSKPVTELGEYSALFYGREKIGKTSLAAQFPDALFLMCEPGAKDLSIFQKEIHSWEEFQGAVDALRDNKKKFKTVVVDTVDMLFFMCRDYVLRELGIEHVSEAEYGKGYDRLKSEFSRYIVRLVNESGRGVIFISHYKESEVQKRNLTSITKVIPSMHKNAREVLEPIVDMWFFIHYNEFDDKREIVIRGDAYVAAGHRFQNHFKGLSKLQMGKTAEEAYQNFLMGFRNELSEPAPKTLAPAPKKRLTLGGKK